MSVNCRLYWAWSSSGRKLHAFFGDAITAACNGSSGLVRMRVDFNLRRMPPYKHICIVCWRRLWELELP